MSSGLAERLRTETRALHTMVERQGVMGQMLRGGVDVSVYCSLLRNLHPIYGALEAALARHDSDPCVALVFSPALRRAPALATDLDELDRPDWREMAPAPATRAYVERLHALDRGGSRALIAHAYVRYLGDLSGGQAVRRVVAARYGLQGGRGTHFYDFGPDEVAVGLKRAFREGLASMPVSAPDIDLIVAEARQAFVRHGALFDQLAVPAGA